MSCNFINYGKQNVSEDDIQAVAEVLRSDFLTQGPEVSAFEQALAEQVQASYVTVTNSATSALHVACLALGVAPGDWVWTSAMSFVASANCAIYCGAEVDFIDIDSTTGNLSVDALEEKLRVASVNGTLPKVLIAVHFAGQSCDMAEIHKLAQEYGFLIIEDASHALGGQYQGKPVGCCEFSDIAVFSFHPVKMITTGEGGCLCTNDAEFAKFIRQYVSHGITKEPDDFINTHSEPWYYEQQRLGYNYRMTDIQAALGRSQLKNLAGWVVDRNSLMDRYYKKTQEFPLQWLQIKEGVLCSFHLAVIKVAAGKRLALYQFLRKHGIGVQVHYIPIYQQPFYAKNAVALEQTDAFYQQVLSLPLYPGLAREVQDRVIHLLKAFFK